jgi:PKD repeat protein
VRISQGSSGLAPGGGGPTGSPVPRPCRPGTCAGRKWGGAVLTVAAVALLFIAPAGGPVQAPPHDGMGSGESPSVPAVSASYRSVPAAVDPRGPLLLPVEPHAGGSGWTNITSLVGYEPPARNESAAAYDARDGYAVVFGGWNGSTFLNDTWSYAADAWTQLHPGAAPSPRSGASLAYDPVDRELLLFGGGNASATFGDTWSYAGGIWSELGTAVHPSARSGASMSFDSALGRVVLYGGRSATGSPLNDSWSFAAGNWSPLAGTSPPARFEALLADDPADSGALLFGGTNGSANQSFGDTWLLKGRNWTEVSAGGGPPALVAPAGLEEPSGNGVLLFGGRSGNGTSFSSALWEFTNGSWAPLITPVTPAARAQAVFVWDVGDDYLLLYGGVGSSGRLNDTWAFASSLVAIPIANALETDVGATVNFAGSASGGVGPYLYAWTSSVGAVRGTSSLSGWNVSFSTLGAVQVTLLVSDSTGDRANASLLLRVDPTPQLRVSAAALSTDVGLPDQFTADLTGGVPPGVVSWAFGDGVSAGGSRIAHAYAAPGNFMVRASVRDAIGRNASGALGIVVAPLPTGRIAVSPGAPSSGAPVDFTASAEGGTGLRTLTWDFGDGSNATGANVTHRYASPGPYQVRLNISDAAGGSTVESLLLNVSAAPAPAPAFLDTAAGIGALLLLVAAVVVLVAVGLRRVRVRRQSVEEELGSDSGSSCAPSRGGITRSTGQGAGTFSPVVGKDRGSGPAR